MQFSAQLDFVHPHEQNAKSTLFEFKKLIGVHIYFDS
jgi:hypothetical protein